MLRSVKIEDEMNSENSIIISDEEVDGMNSTVLRQALTQRVSSPRLSGSKSFIKKPSCSNVNQSYQEYGSIIENKIVIGADEEVDTRSPLLRTALTQKGFSKRLTRIKSSIKRPSCSNVNQLDQAESSMIRSSKKIRVVDSEKKGRSPFLLNTSLTRRVPSRDVKSPIKEPSCSNVNKPSQENRSMICSICLNYWTNLGEHRICCLKCGHAFGFSCVSKWINVLKKNNCPICKAKATAQDIRNIYVNELVAVDSIQSEEQKLELTVEENRLQSDLTQSVSIKSFYESQIRELNNKVNFLNSALEAKSRCTTDGVNMYREKSVELRKEGGCRVLSYYKNGNLIVASTKSSNSLLPGFGAQKIDLATLQPTSYIPLHSDKIRDMQFHSAKSWLLTASLDKTFKIIDINSGTVIAEQNNNNLPLWSCCWNTNDTNSFFVGEQGLVVKYDVRRMSQSTYTYVVPSGDLSTVVSIASITANSAGPLQDGGIIMCKLNSLWVFGNKVNGEECTPHLLPIDPPFICATYDNAKSKMLVSTRPTSTFRCTRHHISNLARKDSNNLSVNISHCFEGSAISTYLSRSCFLTHRGSSYAAAYQELDNMVCLWSTETGQRVSIVPAYNPIFDLCSVNVDNFTYLCSLSDSTLDFFKLP